MFDDETGELEFQYLSGTAVKTGFGERSVGPSPGGLSARVVATGQSVVVNDLRASVDELPGLENMLASGLRSAVGVPLV